MDDITLMRLALAEAEKAAARAVQNENLTAALAEPADLLILDEAGSAWELDMVDKVLLRRAVLRKDAGRVGLYDQIRRAAPSELENGRENHG